MTSLRESRKFIGSPITVRGLCHLEGRKLPFSVRDIVTTTGQRKFSGKISTGDVDCTWEMGVGQNGFWSVRGDFHDGGTLAGDFFFLELLLDKDHSIGAKLEGSILDVVESRHLSIDKSGSDPWIRENWHKFEASQPTVRLHAAPGIGALVATPLVALAVAPVVVVLILIPVIIVGFVVVAAASGASFKVEPCNNTPDQFNEGSKRCIQIVPVPKDGEN